MTTREKAHRLLDELPESEVEPVIEFIASRREGEPEMAELPEAWKTFEDGTPQPNWVALLHESRRLGVRVAQRSSASSAARVQSTPRSLRP